MSVVRSSKFKNLDRVFGLDGKADNRKRSVSGFTFMGRQSGNKIRKKINNIHKKQRFPILFGRYKERPNFHLFSVIFLRGDPYSGSIENLTSQQSAMIY
jgi:hypothetical protein